MYISDRWGNKITPGEILSGQDYPIRHLNGGAAGVKQLLAAPGNAFSYYVTGFILGGGGTADGFYLLRRNCVVFNGNTDTLTIPDNATDLDWSNKAGNGDFAVEMWIKIPAATTDIASLLKRGNEASDGWLLEIASGLVKFTFHDGSNSATITGSTAINDDEWHHIAVTVDRSSDTGLNVYVDGIADATSVDPTSVTDAMDGGTTVVMTGVASKTYYVSTLALYIDATLSAATILSNYNSGVGKKYSGSETSLTMAWNLDEGIGTTCYDILQDSNHNVTLANTAWSPSKQNGSTAAVEVCGVPFDDGVMDAIGKFVTGVLNTNGVISPTIAKFPSAIKIGRNNPLNILETDGAFDLVLWVFKHRYDLQIN